MKVVKPKYTYQDCLDIYRQERTSSNNNIKNPVVLILFLVRIAIFFIGIYCMEIHWRYCQNALINIAEGWKNESGENINVTIVAFMIMVMMFVILIPIFCLVTKVLNYIPKVIENKLIKSGKIKPNRLKNNKDFAEIKDLYRIIDSLIELPDALLEESDYYKTEYGLEIYLKNKGYIEKRNLSLLNYKEDICENECVNFSVLDNKLESLLEELGIPDYKGAEIYEL